MKAAFITIHIGYNFGSILQTIATSEILKSVGANAICINYIPSRVTERRYWQDAVINVRRLFRRILFYPIHYISKKNYTKYLKKYCPLSNPIFAKDDFTKKCPQADVYISGSDQVWNYMHNEGIDKHYFFDGIMGKKIAFASSIGMTEIPQHYADYIQKILKTYSAISVREKSAVELLAKLGIKTTLLIDPTLILTKERWIPYASTRLYKKPYLFVYLPYNIRNKECIWASIKKIADKRNLKIVTYSNDITKEKMADKTILFANPGDLLSLFIYADCVVTNSFHGTAFSINLNKQFFVYMPSQFSTRLSSLIELCGLQSRIIDNIITENTLNQVIDFSKSNQILEQEREKAISFITNALS